MSLPDSHELARLCSLDIGQTVTSDDVRNYLLIGKSALSRFSPDDAVGIAATLLKEMCAALDPRGGEHS